MNAVKLTVVATLALAGVAVPAAPEAVAKPVATPVAAQVDVGDAALDEKAMADAIAKLPAAEQKAYFVSVCKAIAKMPRPIELRAKRYVATCRAALTNAQKGNLTELLTEMFASIEVAALPSVIEMCSQELFNRAADVKRTFTDAEYAKIAKDVVNRVAAHTAEDKGGSIRTTFAILMFIQASNGTPKDLAQQLLPEIRDPAQRTLAEKDWIPAAMGDNQVKTYDPILGYIGELIVPMKDIAVYQPTVLHQSKMLDVLSTELGTSMLETAGEMRAGADLPRTMDPAKPWNPKNTRGSEIPTTPEPKPYNNQTL